MLRTTTTQVDTPFSVHETAHDGAARVWITASSYDGTMAGRPGGTPGQDKARARTHRDADDELVRVLEGIVTSACRVLRAEFGVVVLADLDRNADNIVTVGINATRHDDARDPRTWTTLLSALAATPRPLRLANAGDHPIASAFPSHHPGVTGFLGVPVRMCAHLHGYLYVGNGDGGDSFTASDEGVLVALGAAAGIAVENARLLEREPWRHQWLEVVAETIHLLLGEIERDAALSLVTARLRELCHADSTVIALVDSMDPERPVIFQAIDGLGADVLSGARVPPQGFLADAIESGESVVTDDVLNDSRFTMPPSWREALSELGPGVFIPLVVPGEVLGALLVAWRRDSPHAHGAERMATLVKTFAGAAALALQRDRAHQDRERQQRWVEASSGLTSLLLGEVDLHEAMQVVTRRLRAVSSASCTAIAWADPGPAGTVTLEAVEGLGLEHLSGTRVRWPESLGGVTGSGQPYGCESILDLEDFDPPAQLRDALSTLGLVAFLPLLVRGEVLGVLVAGWETGSPHERVARREWRLLETFTNHAAVALQRVRVQEERERRRRWLTTSSELTRLLLREVDRDEAVRLVTSRLREVSGADYGGVIILEGAPDGMVRMVLDGDDARSTSRVRFPPTGLMALAIDSRHAVVCDDITRHEGYDPPAEWAEMLSGIGLGILIPLVVGGEVLGVLFAAWRKESPYEHAAKESVEQMETFADQAALALQRGRAREDRERRQRWLEASADMTHLLTGDSDRDEALRLVTRRLREASGADYGGIILVDPEARNGASLVVLEGFGTRRLAGLRIARRGLLADVLESGQAFVSNDCSREDAFDPPAELREELSGIGLGMLIPLVPAGEVVGVLFAGWRRGSADEAAARGEVQLVKTFADQAAFALQRGRAQEDRERHQRWLTAAAEMARLLIGEVDRDEAMRLTTRRLREISGADLGGVMLVDPTDARSVGVVVFEGVGVPDVPADTRIPRRGLVAAVLDSGRAVVLDDYTREERREPPAAWAEALSLVGLAMFMPLVAAGELLGVLFVGWQRGSPHERTAKGDSEQIQTFADLAALALQRVRAQGDREHLLLLEDHEQVAHDLHDAVLQRLFAVGLTLHSASAVSAEPEVRRRLDHALGGLEDTTRRVRSTIRRLAGRDADDTRD